MSGRAGHLARFVAGRRTKYLLLVVILGGVALLGPLGEKIAGVKDDGPTSMLPRGAQSTQVEKQLPGFATSGVLPVVTVVERESGLRPGDRRFLRELGDEVESWSAGPSRVEMADDGVAATLTYSVDTLGGDDWPARIDATRELAAAGPSGLESHVTGPAAVAYDEFAVFDGLDAKILAGSIVVVSIILLLTYRSPVLWLLPLVTIGVSTVLAQAVTYLLARHADLPVNSQSEGILPILTFGVGTDYALLLVARYREELRRATDRHTAMTAALRRTAPTVLASAATVVFGLACLTLADLNSTRSLGAVGAVAVACAALALLTVLPVLLLLPGRWVFWPYVPRVDDQDHDHHTRTERRWERVATAVGRRPRRTWLVTAGVLAVLAVPAATLDTGAGQADKFLDPPDSLLGQRVLAEHFPGGEAAPTLVVADADAAADVREVVASTAGVAGITGSTAADGRVLVTATLTAGPESAAAADTVRALRDGLAGVSGADAAVGGPTAQRVDVRTATTRDSLVVMPAALGVVLLVLVFLLRALLGPVVLLASVALSYFAALGIGGLALRALGYEAVDPSTPLLAFVFLVALGVDYTIFLMSRVREETGRHGHHSGVHRGLVSTGGVITSAGLVLAATFGVLWQFPVIVQLGVLVSLGVLLDTFITRSLLVPALAWDIGPRFWWPSWRRRPASRGTADGRPRNAQRVEQSQPNESPVSLS